jgi:hypothetical protein
MVTLVVRLFLGMVRLGQSSAAAIPAAETPSALKPQLLARFAVGDIEFVSSSFFALPPKWDPTQALSFWGFGDRTRIA